MGHELNECAEVHDRADGAFVYLALFGKLYDSVDHSQSLVDSSLVACCNLDVAAFCNLVDRYACAALFLNALDNLSARADHCTDELFGDDHGDDTGYVGLVVLAGCGDSLLDDVEDVHTSFTGLVEGTLEDFVAQTVALDIHLGGGDTVACAGYLEVHVAEVVFIAEDIAQDGIFCAVADKTHGNAADGFLHLHAGVEQGEGAGAYGCHRR